MSESDQGSMTIRLMNGRILKFTYPRAGDDAENRHLTERLFDARQLVLQMDERTIVIPVDNIMMIEIRPSVTRLPDHAIRGVQLRGEVDAV